MHTVIVGGGFAGIKAALELSKKQLGKITLISDMPYFLHHATLYQMASGRDVSASAVSLEDIFAKYHDVSLVKDRMTSVDFMQKEVSCEKTRMSYDALIIAVGSVTDYFGTADEKKHSLGMAALEQVRQFKRHIHDDAASNRQADKAYAVIGGGLTGVELAGALGNYLHEVAYSHKDSRGATSISLVEKSNRLLPRQSKTAAKKVQSRLKELGVKIVTDFTVRPLAKDFITVDTQKIPMKRLVWASGSHGHPFFSKHPHDFALTIEGRVIVNGYLEARDDVYVLGDNAAVPFAGHAQTAMNQGKFIALHLERKALGRPLKLYRPRSVMTSIPVGEKWAYVEKYGVYAAGKTGYLIYRFAELRRLKSLLPHSQAMIVWRALNTRDDDCDLCNV